MKASRLSNRNHWLSVGRRAYASGFTVEAVLTKNDTVNEWIKEGYSKELHTAPYDRAEG